MKKLLFILLILTGCVSQQFVDVNQYNQYNNGVQMVIYPEAVDIVLLLENNGFEVETVTDNSIETTSKLIGQQTYVKIKMYVNADKVKVVIFWKPSNDVAMISGSIGGFGYVNEWSKAIKGNGGRDDLAFAYLISICDKYNKNYQVK